MELAGYEIQKDLKTKRHKYKKTKSQKKQKYNNALISKFVVETCDEVPALIFQPIFKLQIGKCRGA